MKNVFKFAMLSVLAVAALTVVSCNRCGDSCSPCDYNSCSQPCEPVCCPQPEPVCCNTAPTCCY